jgi:spectrin beta
MVDGSGKADSQPSVIDKLRSTGTNVKRAESLRLTSQSGSNSLMAVDGGASKLKRNPSFTTRKRTSSLRKVSKRMENPEDLPPVEMSGFLERKHEQQSGGKRAAIRSWKSYYTVLCGQLLCFFKEQEDFLESKAAASPLNLYQAQCEPANDYTKRKNVFRVRTSDGAEFLFAAEKFQHLDEWVNKISFHAALSPAQQLLSYDSFRVKALASAPSASLSDIAQSMMDTRSRSSVSSLDTKGETEEDKFHSATSSPKSSPELNYKLNPPKPRRLNPANSSLRAPSQEVSSSSSRAPSSTPATEPSTPTGLPSFPRNTAQVRPMSSGDEAWMKLNNPPHTEVQQSASSTYSRASLPPPALPPGPTGQRPVSAVEMRSDTSSESDVPVPSPREEKKKDGREKSKSSVLGIFRRKGSKAPHV